MLVTSPYYNTYTVYVDSKDTFFFFCERKEKTINCDVIVADVKTYIQIIGAHMKMDSKGKCNIIYIILRQSDVLEPLTLLRNYNICIIKNISKFIMIID